VIVEVEVDIGRGLPVCHQECWVALPTQTGACEHGAG
jgi:hypothetical protein